MHKLKEFVKNCTDGGNEHQSICDLGNGEDRDGSIGEGAGNCRGDMKTHVEQRQAYGVDLEVRKEK